MSLIQVLNIRLQRNDCNTPWGFSLQGGAEFHSPIVIHKVKFIFCPINNCFILKRLIQFKITSGSLADRCSVQVGDYVLKIGNVSVEYLTHNQARETIVRQGNNLELTLQRFIKILFFKI
jgi:hypothetical protein